MPEKDPDVTGLLIDWCNGRQEALDELIPLVYPELQKMARGHLRGERRDHTLQTAGLINEAYIRLIDQRRVQWQSRSHFFGICAQMMRRILVDHARKRRAAKRGGGQRKVTLATNIVVDGELEIDALDLHEALEKLEDVDPELGRLVHLRFFGGLTIEQTAEVLGVAPATVKRHWATGKAWLRRELTKE